MFHHFICLILLSSASATFADTVGEVPNAAESGQLTALLTSISEATQQKRVDLIANVLSSQYLESGKKLQNFLKAHGQNPGNFEEHLLNDFNFYTVSGIKKIWIYKDVAFIDATIVYDPKFVANRTKQVQGKNFMPSVWTDMGGTLFGTQWESNDQANATFYFVRQNDLWKLHSTYFSTAPLTIDELKTAHQLMDTLVGPNKLPMPAIPGSDHN